MESEFVSDTPTIEPRVKRTSFRQVGLRTLFLLTALVAVWVAYFNNRRQNDVLTRQIQEMKPLARELIVDDPEQFTVVKQEEQWYDENRWQVYLPPGNFRLCMATRDIDNENLATVSKSVPLPSGNHMLEIKQRRNEDKTWSVLVSANEEEILRVDEPADWDPGHGSSGGGEFSRCTQQAIAQPLILFRRRFTVETKPGSYSAPPGPSNGVLLWIGADAN